MRSAPVLLLLVGCSGEPPCDSADCAADAGGDSCRVAGNLAYNPGFECGTAGWVIADAITVGTVAESSTARTGSKSALMTATRAASALSLWTVEDTVVAPGTRTFCARAWMRGGSAVDTNGWLTLRKVIAGTVQDLNFAMPLSPDWQIVPPPDTGPLEVVGDDAEKILLRIWINDPVAGQQLFVDDVQVWEAPSGSCK